MNINKKPGTVSAFLFVGLAAPFANGAAGGIFPACRQAGAKGGLRLYVGGTHKL